MAAIAEGFVAYAQPLIDQTDGSEEQLNRAFALSQLCYNLALLPDDTRDTKIGELRPALEINDEEFDAFLGSIILPMIRRHEEMFPLMHGGVTTDPGQSVPSLGANSRMTGPAEKYPGTDRYAPCPCNSGEKYKFCCGVKRR